MIVDAPTGDAHAVTFREAFFVWCRIAALSFGGPAGQIAVMHRIFVVGVQFPWIIAVAAFIGYLGNRLGVAAFQPGGGHGRAAGKAELADADSRLGEAIPPHARPSTAWAIKVSAVLLILWFAPIVAIVALTGGASVFTDIAIFFSKMAIVTFGGAYAVLAYVAQQAVEHYGWLRPGEMLDGLGMAETTPGPLIMVLQFVGFMAAFRHPGALPPMVAGTLGGLLTTWVTFVPCFLWIFLGAPYVEAVRANKSLGAALGAITAAVVGVILNLAVWFALHVLFARLVPVHWLGASVDLPVVSSVDVPSLILSIAAAVAIFRFK